MDKARTSKLAVEAMKIVQSGSVAGVMFMALCPDQLFGRWISFPYPWVVSGFLASTVVVSLCLLLMGSLKRAQYGLALTFLAVLAGAMLAH
jgi:hypothetical protein